jgi:hypothetical protein
MKQTERWRRCKGVQREYLEKIFEKILNIILYKIFGLIFVLPS